MRPSLPLVLCGLVLSLVAASSVFAQERERPARIGGKPNLNGLWQALGTAHWNLEGHSAQQVPGLEQLGAFGAIPAGQSVVVGGKIPYRPEALAEREQNRAGWPAADPETRCYMPGIPRATYLPFPFQIVQGDGDMVFAYEFANANRPVFMNPQDHIVAPVDSWMGRSNGRWEGDTLVIEVNSTIDRTWLDRAGNHHSPAMIVTERYTLLNDYVMQYEATIEDPETFTEPWTIRLPLYRRLDENARLLEFNCVEFAEELIYGELFTRDAAAGER